MRRFLNNREGSISILFAICGLAVIFTVGVAVDMMRRHNAQTDAQEALDSAVLLAAIRLMEGESEEHAIAAGVKQFAAACSKGPCADSGTPSIKRNGSKIDGQLAFAVPTTLTAAGGVTSLGASARSQADLTPSSHEFHFLIDVSASLGYGADAANVAALMALTKTYYTADPWWATQMPDGCGFACHQVVGIEPTKPNGQRYTSYELATNAGIKLREDVLAEAVETAANAILANINGVHADQIKVGAYAFSEGWEKLTKPTANSTNLLQKIKQVSIKRNGTHYAETLPAILNDIGKAGNGKDKSSPKKTVILLTDGLNNYYTSGIRTSAIDTALCDQYKQSGIRLVVVNIAYPELPNDNFWYTYARRDYPDLEPALKACASPGYYYEAFDTPQIQATLSKVAKELIRGEIALTL